MKYLFITIIVLLAAYVVSLQRQLDGKGYPFGLRLPGMLDSPRQSSDSDLIDHPNFVGYMANNNYRYAFAFIGFGVGLAGATGWISIRKAENRFNVKRDVEQAAPSNP